MAIFQKSSNFCQNLYLFILILMDANLFLFSNFNLEYSCYTLFADLEVLTICYNYYFPLTILSEQTYFVHKLD